MRPSTRAAHRHVRRHEASVQVQEMCCEKHQHASGVR